MVKRIGWLIFTVVISLLLITNPAFAVPGNGKSRSEAGKVAKNGSAGGRVVQVVKGNKGKSPRLKAQLLQEREKTSVNHQFPDIKAHWARESIEKVQNLGWISGYPDMTFKPDAPVTGIEAVSMMVSLAEDVGTGVEGQETSAVDDGSQTVVSGEESVGDQDEASGDESGQDDGSALQDVPGWARDAMKKAVELKIVNINRFHSQVQATRAQAAVMLAKALGLQPVDASNITFSDKVLISTEDLGYILALADAGIIKGTPDGRFNPNSCITRAEIAAMLAAAADSSGGETTGGTADLTGQTTVDSSDETLTQPADQTVTAEGEVSGLTEQTVNAAA